MRFSEHSCRGSGRAEPKIGTSNVSTGFDPEGASSPRDLRFGGTSSRSSLVSLQLPSWPLSRARSSRTHRRPSRTTSMQAMHSTHGLGTSSLSTNASLMLAGGRLSDLFGRKAIISVAMRSFMSRSLVAALAMNLATLLLAGRSIPRAWSRWRECTGDRLPHRKRGRYLDIFGALWAVAAAIGPILGGVLSENSTWRRCFYLNRKSPIAPLSQTSVADS